MAASVRHAEQWSLGRAAAPRYFLGIAIPLAKRAVCHYGMRHDLKLVGSNLNRRNLEMTFAAPQLFPARLHSLRWVLYVVLALVGVSVNFVGEHENQRARVVANFC